MPDRDKRREQARAEAGDCLARIRETMREHYGDWEQLPEAPDLGPLISLTNDLLSLQRNLESGVWDDAAREAFGKPLVDPKFPALLETAVLSLRSYIVFREKLVDAAPKRPTPKWLRSESEQLIGAIEKLRRPLKRLKTALGIEYFGSGGP
jgi:uncharacterized membrane protein YccC